MPPKAGRFGCLALEKDFSIAEEINTLWDGPVHDLYGPTSLSEAIDLLAYADTVVCNDSGLMHLAARRWAASFVAMYGSSSPDHTPPLSSRARIVEPRPRLLALLSARMPGSGHTDCLNKLMPKPCSKPHKRLPPPNIETASAPFPT